jgi:hypothetical protein
MSDWIRYLTDAVDAVYYGRAWPNPDDYDLEPGVHVAPTPYGLTRRSMDRITVGMYETTYPGLDYGPCMVPTDWKGEPL